MDGGQVGIKKDKIMEFVKEANMQGFIQQLGMELKLKEGELWLQTSFLIIQSQLYGCVRVKMGFTQKILHALD